MLHSPEFESIRFLKLRYPGGVSNQLLRRMRWVPPRKGNTYRFYGREDESARRPMTMPAWRGLREDDLHWKPNR